MLEYGGMYFLVHVVIILLLGLVPLPLLRRCARVWGKYGQVHTIHPRITYIDTLHSPPLLLWGYSDSETPISTY